jgi:NMD protein affecting ribosome stability and mRNA decay
MKKLLKRILFGRVCNWCGKEKDDFYGDMCTDCMGQ